MIKHLTNAGMLTLIIYFDYSQTGQELFYVERQKDESATEDYGYEVLDCYFMISFAFQ